jgi:3-deoxy-D-manno-octulosonic acid kinase
MARWPVLAALGPDVELEETPGGVLAVRRGAAAALRAQGFRPDRGEPARASDLAGRAPLGALELDGARLLVRRFRHGGTLRWMMGRRFADPERPFRELLLSDRLRARGIATPEVVAARARRTASGTPLGRWFGGWRLDLVTRRVEGACDAAQWLEALREERVSPRARRAVARALGCFVGRFHGVGLWHADLNPRNLLLVGDALAAGAVGVQTVDLDRSVLADALDPARRRANLARLLRAVLRRESRGAPFLRRSDLARFLAGYRAGLGLEGGRPEAFAREWRAVAAAHAKGLAVHRLGWRVEAVLGGGPERRDGGAAVRRLPGGDPGPNT